MAHTAIRFCQAFEARETRPQIQLLCPSPSPFRPLLYLCSRRSSNAPRGYPGELIVQATMIVFQHPA